MAAIENWLPQLVTIIGAGGIGGVVVAIYKTSRHSAVRVHEINADVEKHHLTESNRLMLESMQVINQRNADLLIELSRVRETTQIDLSRAHTALSEAEAHARSVSSWIDRLVRALTALIDAREDDAKWERAKVRAERLIAEVATESE